MDRARRAMPIGNKQCYARHVQANQEKHKYKMATVKCSIDNSAPKRFSHLQRNQKKEQMMEERYAEIERDNRFLLEKMSHIMRVSLISILYL
jgi:E3 ubiquitin-protein ligase TRIP12